MALTEEEKQKIIEEEELRAKIRADNTQPVIIQHKKQGMGCGGGCLCVILVFLGAIFFVIATDKKKPERTIEEIGADLDKARTKACNENYSAIRAAQEAVTKVLKSPTTAKFPGAFLEPQKDTFATKGKDCSWTVSSYVDSQNSFGAMIRSNWQVNLKLQSMNRFNHPVWTITDVKIK